MKCYLFLQILSGNIHVARPKVAKETSDFLLWDTPAKLDALLSPRHLFLHNL